MLTVDPRCRAQAGWAYKVGQAHQFTTQIRQRFRNFIQYEHDQIIILYQYHHHAIAHSIFSADRCLLSLLREIKEKIFQSGTLKSQSNL